MSVFDEYNEFIDILWHTDINGNNMSIKRINEQYKISNNMIILQNIPDKIYKVFITGKYEIDINQKLPDENYYKVNYLTGEMFFHENLDGNTVIIDEYYGRGVIRLFGKRIVIQDSNNNWISDNLEDLASEIKLYIDSSVSNKIDEDQLDNIKGIGYTNQTIKGNYDLINTIGHKVDAIIDKVPVENYSDLSIEYPDPEVGTHVFVKGTNNFNERGYYLFIDGETKISNGENNSNWEMSEGSFANENGLNIMSGVNEGNAILNVNLNNNVTYIMEYEIRVNNAPINSLYINNTIIKNIALLSKNLGRHTIEITTKDSIEINTLEIKLNNLSGNNEGVLVQIISLKEKDSFMWRRDTDLIPLADANRNGLLSKSDYNQIHTNKNNIASNLIKINKNTTDIATNAQNYQDHLNSVTAHKDDSIANTSAVAGSKVKDALNSLNIKDQQLNSRIDNIVSQAGNSNTEIVDSRNSAKYGNFASLDARLENIETRSKYFARENHVVTNGSNIIALTSLPENNHKLLIYDKKYGAIWNEVEHWTRSGATITFTSLMPEDLNFVVINLG